MQGPWTRQELVSAILTRPHEPIFIPKGPSKIAFDLTTWNMLPERFNSIKEGIHQHNLANDSAVRLSQFAEGSQPDLTLIMELDRHAKFSVFIPHHRRLLRDLVKIFFGRKTSNDFLSAAAYARDLVNPSLFVDAFCIALLHRPDAKDLEFPHFYEMFPSNFVDGKTIQTMKLHLNLFPAEKCPKLCIPQDWTANNLDFEHRLAYFREDIGLNSHHWHWHLVYPFDCPEQILNKDRRGELFYYMHQQLVGRYNTERLCNDLGRVKRFFELKEEIAEGYFPKIDQPYGIRSWASRHAGSKLSNVWRESEMNVFDIEDLIRWKNRIIDAIHWGAVVDEKGEMIPLDEKHGIDILGNIVEACPTLSKNYPLYGDLHNFGHLAIALSHDPDGRYLEEVSVMGVPATACRDPVFYRWHAFINYIFELHKNTLPPYTPKELGFQGIMIMNVEVNTGASKNTLYTHWETIELDVSGGLDFAKGDSVFVELTRLQNCPFSYKIEVVNRTGAPVTGTVRIFLSPKYDEKGQEMLFIDQKSLFIELDRFPVVLKGRPNMNIIKRESTESTVGVEYEPRTAKSEKPSYGKAGDPANPFCGCGWPQNLLIPKGKPEGFPCQLFVMISNDEYDEAEEIHSTVNCTEQNSYCGARDQKYPDRRAMGFPFDRLAGNDPKMNLKDFLKPNLNMFVTDVNIVFHGDNKPCAAEDGRPQPENRQCSNTEA